MSADNTSRNTGAVYCSTMALAAVVILLARANRAVTPIMDRAPMNTCLLKTSLWRRMSR